MQSFNVMKRENISSGTPWEPLLGYSRAVRMGNVVYVSGTTAIDVEGNVLGEGSAYYQTKRAIEIIKESLEKAGASLSDVVRTRMFVTDISRWKEYGQAHREAFEKIRPANTLVEVKSLVDPRMLIEIEAEAVMVPS